VIDIAEILIRQNAGRPKNEMAVRLGVGPKTIREDLAPAEAVGVPPGGHR
jgi:predicted transcriptional regulator